MNAPQKSPMVGDYGLEPADLIGVGRTRVWMRQPYFESLLFKLKPVERSHHGGISVDEGLRLYYDPELVVRWGVKYLPTFCAHEVQHPLRGHVARARALKQVYYSRYCGAVAAWLRETHGIQSFQDLLNWAADLEINDDVERAGFEWPPDFVPLRPAQFKFDEGLTFEDYTRAFIERAEKAVAELPPPVPIPPPPPGGGAGPGGEGECDDEGTGEPGEGGDGGDEAQDSGRGPVDSGPDERDEDGQDEGDAAPPEESDGEGTAEPPAEGADGDGEPRGQSGASADEDADEPPQTDPRLEAGAGPGRGCCGGCAHNPVVGEGEDEALLPEPIAPDDLELTKVNVAQAVLDWMQEQASGAKRGVAPGGWLVDWAKSMFQPPRLNPYALLARLIRGAIGRVVEYQRPKFGEVSRRRETMVRMGWGQEAPLVPNYRAPQPRVVFAVDTSGSMGAGEKSRLNDALREAWGFCQAAHGNVYGIAVDAQVHAAREVREQSDLVTLARGGGGTDMRLGIAAMADPKLRADVMVLLTDGETPWPEPKDTPRDRPLIVVIVNDNRYYFDHLPKHLKGRAVYLGQEATR